MIESEFGIVIEGEDIGADNFQSLDCIEALICRK
jgi:acyl carrier protein